MCENIIESFGSHVLLRSCVSYIYTLFFILMKDVCPLGGARCAILKVGWFEPSPGVWSGPAVVVGLRIETNIGPHHHYP